MLWIEGKLELSNKSVINNNNGHDNMLVYVTSILFLCNVSKQKGTW